MSKNGPRDQRVNIMFISIARSLSNVYLSNQTDLLFCLYVVA